MTLALGVDGGGTQTRCVVLDDHGRMVGSGVSGASKPDAVEASVGTRHLHEAIRMACAGCGVESIDTAFLGIGGVNSDVDRQVVLGMLDGLGLRPGIPLGVDLDIVIALAGGTAGQPGITLIVGTGSSCYGRNAAGEAWRSGGWGYIVDDYGSGFFLGQQALEAVIRAADGRAEPTALTEPCMAALGITDINTIMHRIYYPKLDFNGIASLAPLVVEVAERDATARAIVERGCAELALMVSTVTRKLRLPADVLVIPVGSLGTVNVYYRRALEAAIARVLPSARVRPPIAPPVIGAAFLALQQVGITLPEATLRMLAERG
ncbi:MAG: BadF/BadG/BcrA/BcrD ATPase family protein [Anaerolineae bacterium]